MYNNDLESVNYHCFVTIRQLLCYNHNSHHTLRREGKMNENHIGTKIAQLRKAKGITQQALAYYINYSDKVISKWERGESIPDIYALKKLAEYFGVTLEEIVRECAPSEKADSNTNISKFRLPLILLQIILMLYILSLLARVVAISLLWENEWSITAAMVLSLLMALPAFAEMISVHARINRMPAVFSFFGVCVVSAIVLIFSYFTVGVTNENIILTPIYRQIFATVGLFGIGYFLEKNKDKKKTVFYEKETEEAANTDAHSRVNADYGIKNRSDFQPKKTLILSVAVLIITVLMTISFVLPAYTITIGTESGMSDNLADEFSGFNFNDIFDSFQRDPYYWDDEGLYGYYLDEEGNPVYDWLYLDEEGNLVCFYDDNNDTWENVISVSQQVGIFDIWFSSTPSFFSIITCILFFLITVWDIISIIANIVYLSRKKISPLFHHAATQISLLISSGLFVVFFVINQLLILNSTGDFGGISVSIDILYGFILSLIFVAILTVTKIALFLQRNRSAFVRE